MKHPPRAPEETGAKETIIAIRFLLGSGIEFWKTTRLIHRIGKITRTWSVAPVSTKDLAPVTFVTGFDDDAPRVRAPQALIPKTTGASAVRELATLQQLLGQPGGRDRALEVKE